MKTLLTIASTTGFMILLLFTATGALYWLNFVVGGKSNLELKTSKWVGGWEMQLEMKGPILGFEEEKEVLVGE